MEDIFKGKLIALLVWSEENDEEAHVYLGELSQTGDEFYFTNKTKGWKVALQNFSINLLKPVTSDTKEIFLEADFFLQSSIQTMPETSTDEFIPTGLKWH